MCRRRALQQITRWWLQGRIRHVSTKSCRQERIFFGQEGSLEANSVPGGAWANEGRNQILYGPPWYPLLWSSSSVRARWQFINDKKSLWRNTPELNNLTNTSCDTVSSKCGQPPERRSEELGILIILEHLWISYFFYGFLITSWHVVSDILFGLSLSYIPEFYWDSFWGAVQSIYVWACMLANYLAAPPEIQKRKSIDCMITFYTIWFKMRRGPGISGLQSARIAQVRYKRSALCRSLIVEKL